METNETKKTNDEALVQVLKLNSLEHATEEAIRASFLPFYEQATEWKEKALAVVVTDINQVELMQQAREARLILKDLRVSADKKRKELKEDSLAYGRAVQGVYNFIEDLIKPIEKHLQAQEDFVTIQETRIREELRESRNLELQPFAEFVPVGIDLGNYTETEYQNLLYNCRVLEKNKKDREAEEKAAAEKAAQERAEAEEAQRKENEILKAEAEAREKAEAEAKAKRAKRNEELRPYAMFIRDYNAMLDMSDEDYTSALAEIIVGAKQHWEHEAAEQKKKEQKEADYQLQLKKEQEAREKAERELKAKKEAEEKAAAEKAAAEEAEAAKGDTAKFADLIVQLGALKTKYTFKSRKYKGLQNAVNVLIDKIIEYATNPKTNGKQ